MVVTLKHVGESADFSLSVRHEATILGDNLCKFQTVLVAFVYIRIFDITTPVSDYLQTSGLDLLQAWRMVADATMRLKIISRDFECVYERAAEFTKIVNTKLSSDDILVSSELSSVRSTRRIPGDGDQKKQFEVVCHNVIFDKVVESINKRFMSHKDLYEEIACFDPQRFHEVNSSPQMINLTKLSKSLPEMDCVALKEELVSFASNFKHLKQGLLEDNSDEEESN